MKPICRLCLKACSNGHSIHQTDSNGVTTSSLVKALIPELYLGLSVNPVVCKDCYFHLRQAHIFRLQCLRSENLIGIYIRETKNTNSTINLEFVVDYWLQHCKNKPNEIKGNLEEWFGTEKNQSEEPIVLNQTANICNLRQDIIEVDLSSEQQKQKNVAPEARKKNTSSESDSEVLWYHNDKMYRTPNVQQQVGCRGDCSKSEDCPTCTLDKLKRDKNKINEDGKISKFKESIVLKDAVAEFDEYINNACMELAGIAPLQSVGVRTYKKRQKVPEVPPVKTNLRLAKKVKPVQGEQTINLVGDLDDDDINSLIEELQKDENLKKLGFGESDANKKETYVLKKIIDKSDNSLSFALLPKTVPQRELDDVIDKHTAVVNVQDVIDKHVEAAIDKVATNLNLSDSMDGSKSHAVTNEKCSESEGANAVKVRNVNEFGQSVVEHRRNKDSKNCKNLLENVQVKINDKKLEGTLILSPLNDRIGVDITKDDTVPGNIHNSSVGNSVPPAQEIDEESLGIISFHQNVETLTERSTSQTKPPLNPMPIIRVRPVSTLQKVRTLNHELWPQKPVCGDGGATFEASSNIYKLPINFEETQSNQAPIVLNSKLGSTDLVSTIEPPKPPHQPIKPPLLKTYVRRVGGRPLTGLIKSSQLRHLNPLVLKNLDHIHNMGKIQMVSASDSPRGDTTHADVELTKQDVLNGTSLKSSIDSTGDDASSAKGSRRSRDERTEDAIDIKDEPLDCMESDVLMNFGASDHKSQGSTDSEGETTRSASETSFMDSLGTQNDLVKSIVDNIPEVGEEQYDEPEYVHINQVSFSDLARLVDESKKHKGKLLGKEQSPESMNLTTKVTADGGQSGATDDDRNGYMKYCFVPKCPNNSKRGPHKIFVNVPRKKKVQRLWCEAVGRPFCGYPCCYFCCEDHFDVETDLENYVEYKRFGKSPLVKKGVLPHIFSCFNKPETVVKADLKSELSDDDVVIIEPPIQSSETQSSISEPNNEKEPHNRLGDAALDTNKNQNNPVFKHVKHCFLPGCENNSRRCPSKIFINVPTVQEEQKRWFETVGLLYGYVSSRRIYCCEDHFDIDKDLENYPKYNKMFDGDILTKKGVVPHKCLSFRKAATVNNINSALRSKPSKVEVIKKTHQHRRVADLSTSTNEPPYQIDPRIEVCAAEPCASPNDIRYCFAPGCKSNSREQPNQTFLSLPTNTRDQKLWFKAVERPYPSTREIYFCCQDHFKLVAHYVACERFGGDISKIRNTKNPDGEVLIEDLLQPLSETELRMKQLLSEIGKKESGTRDLHLKKYCFVPYCNNNSDLCPTKVFISVPVNEETRKRWFAAVKLPYSVYKTSQYYCCEDHFDARLLTKYKIYGPDLLHMKSFLPYRLPEAEVPVKDTRIALSQGRYCFVPHCKNNSMLNPSKVFVKIPGDEKEQKRWVQAVGRTYSFKVANLWCCEDHFDMKNDMISYSRSIKYVRCSKMKKGVLPHKFLSKPIAIETESKTTEPNTSKFKIKHCFVPGCWNNSIERPDKIFVVMPLSETSRKKWFEAVGRDFSSSSTAYFCCEDHFATSGDMTNYRKRKAISGQISKGILPHHSISTPEPSEQPWKRLKIPPARYGPEKYTLVEPCAILCPALPHPSSLWQPYHLQIIDLPAINLGRFRTQITSIIRNNTTPEHQRSQSATGSIAAPIVENPRNTSRFRKRGGKRLRLIQVDANGMDVEVVPTRRRRVNQRSVLRSNLESTSRSEAPKDERNLVVLYTNFTSEGDYINDHDYLINPYVRNQMYYHSKFKPVCVCLLCDLVHKANDHIGHMKTHGTVCRTCRIDFHNVFILNLHVRSHSTYCRECKVTVSYSAQIPHARLHNRSLNLSNIDVSEDIVQDYLGQREGTSQPEKEKEPPPSNKLYKSLEELLSEPITDRSSRLGTRGTSPSISPRISTMITRSRKLEFEEFTIDGKEASIYDKTTKSFITPTAEKQQKLLEKCSNGKPKKMHNSLDDGSNNGEEALKNNKTKTDTVSVLFCEETIEDKTATELLSINTLLSTKNSPVQSTKDSTLLSHSTKIEPKKIDKITKKKRRKRYDLMRKKKPKIRSVSKKAQSNVEESKDTKSPELKTDDLSYLLETKSDLKETDYVNISLKNEETAELQYTQEPNNTEKLESGSAEKKSTRQRAADEDLDKGDSSENDSKTSVTKLKANIVGIVRSYSKPSSKRTRETDNQEAAHSSPSEKNEDGTTVAFTKVPGTPVLKKEINEIIGKILKRSKQDSFTTMTDAVEIKSAKDVSRKSENVKQRETDSSKTESPIASKSNSPKPRCVDKKLLDPTSSANILFKTDTLDSASYEFDSPNTIPENSAAPTPQESKIKSPTTVDLKMRIKTIKYNPLVSWAKKVPDLQVNVLTSVPTKKPKVLKTYDRASRKRNRDTNNPEVVSHTLSEQKEQSITSATTQVQESSQVTVDEKDKAEKNAIKNVDKNDDGKRDLRPNPFTSSSKLRSSRSRGSLGLVEGLKGSERRVGHKIPKKSKKIVQDDSSVNLDRSEWKNADFDEPCLLENGEPDKESIINGESSPSNNIELNETS